MIKLFIVGILFLFLTQSCSFNNNSINIIHEDEKEQILFVWDVIEKCAAGTCTKNNIIQILGAPKITMPDKKNQSYEVLIYYNKQENLQEWAFTFNKEEKFISLVYLPSFAAKQNIKLDEIKKRWSGLNCVVQEKIKDKVGTIMTATSLACDNNQRIVEYNKYNEVSSIGIISND